MHETQAAPPLPAGAEPLDTETRQRTYQSLGNHPLLEHAKDSTVTRFLAAVRLYQLPPGARFLDEGADAQAVFFLTAGAVRIVHQHDGTAFTPKVLAAPCHFGHMELLAGVPLAFQSIDTITRAVIAELTWTDARELLLNDHALALAWLEDLARQFLHTADAIRHYAFGDLRARVAGVILSYADLSATPGEAEGAPAIAIPLSLSALSRHVACPKRSVLRAVQSLQKDKLLLGDARGALSVPSSERLAAAMPFRRVSLTHRGRLPAVLVNRRPVSRRGD